MRATRRFWVSCATVVALAVLTLVFAAPSLLAGVVLLSAWLLTEQYRFVKRVAATVETTTIQQQLPQQREAVNSTTTVSVHVQRDTTTLEMTVEPQAPTGVRGDPPMINLSDGEQETQATFELVWPIAGSFTLPEPTLALRDRLGLFEERIDIGTSPGVVIEPHAPRNLQVGAGGDEIAATYGNHSAQRGGSGLDPAELRKYMPGDPSNRIDWKATARLDDTYVREFEAQTDRETVFVIDNRASLADGEDGRTKFDYLREVLLAMTDIAERLDDPVGFTALDEDGITDRIDPSIARNQYQSVRTRLHELGPTNREHSVRGDRRTPSQASAIGAQLQGDTSAFGEALRPYFASLKTHVERVTDEPLFHAVNHLSSTEEARLLVIATDDNHRRELEEAVKLAVQRGNQVVVFLTPDALFDDYALADLEATYDEYVSFETIRRKLDRVPRTRAFEVGPGDRIDTALQAGHSHRGREVANDS